MQDKLESELKSLKEEKSKQEKENKELMASLKQNAEEVKAKVAEVENLAQ